MPANNSIISSKRRNFTYGKTSRRVLDGVQGPAANFFSTMDEDESNDGPSRLREGLLSSPMSSPLRGDSASDHNVVSGSSASTPSSDEILAIKEHYDALGAVTSKTALISRQRTKRSSPSVARLPIEKRRRLRKEDQEDEIENGSAGTSPKENADVVIRKSPYIRMQESSINKRRPIGRELSKTSTMIQLGKLESIKAGLRSSNKGTNKRVNRGKQQESSELREVKNSLDLGPHVPTTERLHAGDSLTESLKDRVTPPRTSSEAPDQHATPSSLPIPNLKISAASSRRSPTPTRKANISVGHFKPSVSSSSARQKLKDKLINNSSELNHPTKAGIDRITSGKTTLLSIESNGNQSETLDAMGQDRYSKSQESNTLDVVSAPGIVQNPGPKVTYAAGHRTVLQEPSDTIFESTMIAGDTLLTKSKRNRQLPCPANYAQRVLDDEDVDEPQNSMKSIHELRKAGVNQRLSRQTEALLDDVESSSSLPQQRLALTELIKGLQSPSSVRQFLEFDYETRLMNALETNSDEIICFLLSTIFLLTSNDSTSHVMLEQSFRERIVDFLSNCLSNDKDVQELLQIRKFSISKDLRKQVQSICQYIMELSVWGSPRPRRLTCQLVCLQCLESIVRKTREARSTEELLSKDTIERLVEIVDRTDFGAKEKASVSFISVRLALSTLESSAVVYNVTELDCSLLWTEHAIRRLCDSLVNLPNNIQEDRRLLSLFLRLGLNLSNSSLAVCTAFSRADVIGTIIRLITGYFPLLPVGSDEIEQNLVLDNLILSLGLLINLCEKRPKTCELFLESSRDAGGPLVTVIRLFLTRVPNAFEVI